MTISATYHIDDLENKIEPMPHHKAGLQWTATGYGRKIPTTRMVKLPGGKKWRRVYCCIYSNSGTCYVADRKTGNWTVIYST